MLGRGRGSGMEVGFWFISLGKRERCCRRTVSGGCLAAAVRGWESCRTKTLGKGAMRRQKAEFSGSRPLGCGSELGLRAGSGLEVAVSGSPWFSPMSFLCLSYVRSWESGESGSLVVSENEKDVAGGLAILGRLFGGGLLGKLVLPSHKNNSKRQRNAEAKSRGLGSRPFGIWFGLGDGVWRPGLVGRVCASGSLWSFLCRRLEFWSLELCWRRLASGRLVRRMLGHLAVVDSSGGKCRSFVQLGGMVFRSLVLNLSCVSASFIQPDG